MRIPFLLFVSLLLSCLSASAVEPSQDLARITVIVTDYCAAWSEPEPARRLALLQKTWAEKGTYTDPTAIVEGRDALHQHIGKFFEQFPGAKIVLSSGVDVHHDKLRFGWQLVAGDGSIALEGMDYGELDENGLIQRIVGFFGPMPVKP
ncbi:MAG: nuclear transport factor 2 family protein [Burkholderiales bacterium]|nr:nuclear transport factor 2 family protein [Burkholderiales bacterium]